MTTIRTILAITLTLTNPGIALAIWWGVRR